MVRHLFMNKKNLLIVLAVSSLILYTCDYVLLGSVKELTIWLLGNLAFLPLYVIIVTFMIDHVMKERERQSIMRKLNMVIGVFFSEIGNQLLRELTPFVLSNTQLKQALLVTPAWGPKEFSQAERVLTSLDISVNCASCDITQLRNFMVGKRNFLVGLLENQSLLEHEQFTDLLWSVFHLVEELDARPSLADIPVSDREHLNGDVKRVLGHLCREWLLYMQHLKTDYPYLFSLAVRLNPLHETVDPHVY